MSLAESSESKPSRFAVASRVLARRPRPSDGSHKEDGGGPGGKHSDSRSDSNAAARRADQAHPGSYGTQRHGAATRGWPELITMRSTDQIRNQPGRCAMQPVTHGQVSASSAPRAAVIRAIW
jgi:hypothetical protein